MAVWTEQPQIFKSVIRGNAVDVVELQDNTFVEPFGQSTCRASIIDQTRGDKPSLKAGRLGRSQDEELLERPTATSSSVSNPMVSVELEISYATIERSE
jgi:hypothetical protein